MRFWMAGVLVIVGMAVSVGACSRQGKAPANLAGIDYPDWVMEGSGAFDGDEGRVFYGVGSVSGIKNHALARRTADNRARAEIVKILETYSASLMKDYMASTSDGESASEEQQVEQAIKTFSAGTISGVQVVDHFYHPVDGSVFALARLDLEAFSENLEKMKELNSEVREYVKRNAERVHMDLEREEARHRER